MQPQALPAVPPLPGRRFSPLMIVTAVLMGLGSVGAAIFIVWSNGPVAAVVCTLVAAISVPLLILGTVWLDRYEPEPRRYRVAAIAWGALGGTTIGGGLNLLIDHLTGAPDGVSTAVLAPLCEEFGKGLFLVFIMVWRRRELDGILDGIVYAASVGVGFAFVENILYYSSSLNEGGVGALTVTFVLRGVFGPFAHPLFTSATGIGIGIAVTTTKPALRVIAPIAGYLVGAGLHGLWNGSLVLGGFTGYLLTYLIGILPVLAVVIGIGIWARAREGRMLTAALQQCAGMGWVGADEIRWVASLSNRSSARRFIANHQGKPAAKIARDYQQSLTEMAFLHGRVMRGVAPPRYDTLMQQILARVQVLRPYVSWPPAPVGPAMPPGYPPLPPGGPPAGGPPMGGPPMGGPPMDGPPTGGPPTGGPPLGWNPGPGEPPPSSYQPIPGGGPR